MDTSEREKYLELGDREDQKIKMLEMARLSRNILGILTCKNCNDTGYEGWDTINNQFLPCQKCVIAAAEQAVGEKIVDKENEEKTRRIIVN